jgi:peptidoglycan/xylan/chitin deacetylase (PgdA/CDA1 family)
MRIDRLLTLYFFGPMARIKNRLGFGHRGLCIPILMYHSISDEPETGHPYYWINTSPAQFAEHMKFLYENEYQVISLKQAVEMVQAPSLKPEFSGSTGQQINKLSDNPNDLKKLNKPVVLTFDDGYRDFYTEAFPILQEYGFTATVFLPTAYIDGIQPSLRGKAHLSWNEVNELADRGINFGSHTVNHPQLHDLTFEEIEYEIIQSKAQIESQLNIRFEQSAYIQINQTAFSNLLADQPFVVDSFSYPYKFQTQDEEFIVSLKSILQKTGYTNCSTTCIACANQSGDDMFLPRLPVNSGDDIPLFQAKLEGGYDWLKIIQTILKKLESG